MKSGAKNHTSKEPSTQCTWKLDTPIHWEENLVLENVHEKSLARVLDVLILEGWLRVNDGGYTECVE